MAKRNPPRSEQRRVQAQREALLRLAFEDRSARQVKELLNIKPNQIASTLKLLKTALRTLPAGIERDKVEKLIRSFEESTRKRKEIDSQIIS